MNGTGFVDLLVRLFKCRSECRMYKAKFEAAFTSEYGAINFNTDLSPHLLISGIATEKWSREYFEALKE